MFSSRAVPPIAKVEVHHLLRLLCLDSGPWIRLTEWVPPLLVYGGDPSPTTPFFAFEPRRTSVRILVEFDKFRNDFAGFHCEGIPRGGGLGMSARRAKLTMKGFGGERMGREDMVLFYRLPS
jgi:hypothetical protein